MRFKLTACVAFFVFFTTINAQINYTKEEVEQRYNTETIILQPNAFEKNGVSTRMNGFFPNEKLLYEIASNGGREANDQYEKYKDAVIMYWLANVLGIVGVLVFSFFALSTVTQTGLLLYLVSLFGFTLLITRLGNKVHRLLSKAVWYHNKNVLLRK
ncbi:MAG: hypothetical protein U5L45_02900 [Saprospiraceae bacterium]|nr:hypothetical protein [Saprospiraceae bacterium]